MTRGRFGSRAESEQSAFTNALAIFGLSILKFAVMLDVAVFLPPSCSRAQYAYRKMMVFYHSEC